MSEPNIPAGTYKLSRDVQNPKADRRHTRDWRKVPIWNRGSRFVVKEQRRMGDKHLAEVTVGLDHEVVAELRAKDRYTVVELAGSRWPGSHRIGPGDEEQYAALASALVPCEESLSQFMTRIDIESGFVEWLLEHKHVTRADVEKWWHSYQYGDEDEAVEPPAVITLPVHDDEVAADPRVAPESRAGVKADIDALRGKPDLGLDPDRGHGGYDWGALSDETTHPGKDD